MEYTTFTVKMLKTTKRKLNVTCVKKNIKMYDLMELIISNSKELAKPRKRKAKLEEVPCE